MTCMNMLSSFLISYELLRFDNILGYIVIVNDETAQYLYYLGLLKAVMRFSMKALRAADAKEVASSVATYSS
ncbi:hypothetical protein QQP08_005693 [Theobroma cacao]|nr:hypothetical protein QQP08_005693 [Theobroma cacao]